jgi:hypothetical protein
VLIWGGEKIYTHVYYLINCRCVILVLFHAQHKGRTKRRRKRRRRKRRRRRRRRRRISRRSKNSASHQLNSSIHREPESRVFKAS